MVVELTYQPRTPRHADIHRGMDRHRFGAVVAHRRFGKTVCAVVHLLLAALENKRRDPEPRYGFIAPFREQAKDLAWQYLLRYSEPIPGCIPMISELKLTLPTGGQVRLYGADNPESFRGRYFDGVVLDEFGEMAPNTFSEILRPTLSDYGGWALFLGTPQGRNQFYRIIHGDPQTGFLGAKHDPTWYFAELKASQTGVLPQHELDAARKDMTADEYAQEYECSFEASVKGAIYAAELASARANRRIGVVPYDPILPVDTHWDLGVGDATSIWFDQSLRSGEIRLIDYYEASGEGLPHYAQILKEKGYTYGRHWAPHDIQVRELASGRSRLEAAASLGIRFEVTPDLPLEDGIHAARMLFPRCWFDEQRCRAGLEALQHYRRDYNSRLNEFKAVPVHDWASHGCLIAGTLIDCERGAVPIEQVTTDDRVWTPAGLSRVLASGPTKRAEQLVHLELADGQVLSCTPEHKILTPAGFLPADALRYTTRLYSGDEWICQLIAWCSTVFGIGFRAAITGESLGVGGDHRISTELSGSSTTVRYPPIITYTTATAMAVTMFSGTWSVSSEANTYAPIRKPWWQQVSSNHHPNWLSDAPPNRSEIQPVMPGGRLRHARPGLRANGIRASVETVVSRFCRRILSVQNGAISIAKWRHCGLPEDKPWVYDLTVENHGCYRANGVLVSNSDAFRYLAVSQQPPAAKKPQPVYVPGPHGNQSWLGV